MICNNEVLGGKDQLVRLSMAPVRRSPPCVVWRCEASNCMVRYDLRKHLTHFGLSTKPMFELPRQFDGICDPLVDQLNKQSGRGIAG